MNIPLARSVLRTRRALEDRAASLAVFATTTLLALFISLDLLARGELDIDFRSFYFAWQAARAGADIYDVSVLNHLAERQWGAHNHVWPYIYPPFLAYVFSPLASAGFVASLVGWALASIAALGVALTALVSSSTPGAPDAGPASKVASPLPLQEAVLLGVLLVCLLPLRANIAHGQVNLFVLALMALSVRAFVRGDDVWSGIWLAPAILVKLTPGVLVVAFLARRRPRAAVACGAAMLLLAGATLPLGAWPAWITYVRELPRLSHGAVIEGLFDPGILGNFSPAGMFSRWFEGQPAPVRTLSSGLAVGLVLLTAVFVRGAGREGDDGRALAPFFPLMLLISPLAYVHHVIYLAPAAVVWIDRARREHRPWVLISVAILLGVAGADLQALYERLWIGETAFRAVTSINLYAVLGLFGVGLHLLRARSPAGEPVEAEVAEGARTEDGVS